jgi:hypothetical protein
VPHVQRVGTSLPEAHDNITGQILVTITSSEPEREVVYLIRLPHPLGQDLMQIANMLGISIEAIVEEGARQLVKKHL